MRVLIFTEFDAIALSQKVHQFKSAIVVVDESLKNGKKGVMLCDFIIFYIYTETEPIN